MVHRPPYSTGAPPTARRQVSLTDRRCSAISAHLVAAFIPSKRARRTSTTRRRPPPSPPQPSSTPPNPPTPPPPPSSSSAASPSSIPSPASSLRFPMLRSVRDRLRLRRVRRHDPSSHSAANPSAPTTTTGSASITGTFHGSAHTADPTAYTSSTPPPRSPIFPDAPRSPTANAAPPNDATATPAATAGLPRLDRSPRHTIAESPHLAPEDAVHSDVTPSAAATPANKSDAISNHSSAHDDASAAAAASSGRQPRVFRNRSLEYGHRRDRQFLGLFAGRALRTFHRARPPTESKLRSPRDRPLDAVGASGGAAGSPHERPLPYDASQRVRNDDSFSSLPSTHASRDPFLNDDVPVDISRLDAREDRPRPVRRDHDDPLARNLDGKPGGGPSGVTSAAAAAMAAGGGGGGGEGSSPPPSMSSASTSRKRSSLWKRKYDPHDDFQTPHERDILKAVALSEASVKEHNVRAAQQVALIVDQQVAELDAVLADVDSRVERARSIAGNLPATRDTRFEPYLYTHEADESDDDADKAQSQNEQVFSDLQWMERVWDVEAFIMEKRFEDAVSGIEKLQVDGISEAVSPRTYNKFQTLILQLVSEMSACCAQGGGEAASIFAPLLGRLGMADHARQVVLDSAETELMAELRYITSNRQDVTPRTINVILDKTLSIFKYTYNVYMKISSTESTNSSSLVAWIVEQSDKVYAEFVSPVLARMKKADPVTILATIEAARHRRRVDRSQDRHRVRSFQTCGVKDEKSLVALLETRMTTHVRKELDGPIRDAERQLVERARMYASAIPRNWREGPYQSGKAVCDELNVLSRGLEGALLNLGAEADVLMGNLLVRPALMYCTTLLEIGTKAVGDEEELKLSEVQHGVFATFMIIGKTLLRLHHKFATVPMLERVGVVLTSANLGEVRILQAELFARRSSARMQSRQQQQGITERLGERPAAVDLGGALVSAGVPVSRTLRV